MGFGTAAFGRRIRFYSIGTILILLVPSIVVFLYVPQISASVFTPWIGIAERISTYGYLLWQAVLAIVLLHAVKEPGCND